MFISSQSLPYQNNKKKIKSSNKLLTNKTAQNKQKIQMTTENIADFIDEFNLSENENYDINDFKEDLTQLPDIVQVENENELQKLWQKYTELKSVGGENKRRQRKSFKKNLSIWIFC